MITKDYDYVKQIEKFVEPEIQKCISQICKGAEGDVERKLYIPPGAHIICRYVEAIFVNGIEVASVEVNGRSVDICSAGYRSH